MHAVLIFVGMLAAAKTAVKIGRPGLPQGSQELLIGVARGDEKMDVGDGDMSKSTSVEPEVIFSLRKSRVRREVLTFLMGISPKCSYPSEIARRTHLNVNDVVGALHGTSGRYHRENSLERLDWWRERIIARSSYTKLLPKVWPHFSPISKLYS
jgi:predicted transcriptional regulator with HTH domain